MCRLSFPPMTGDSWDRFQPPRNPELDKVGIENGRMDFRVLYICQTDFYSNVIFTCFSLCLFQLSDLLLTWFPSADCTPVAHL